ncbi:MAG: hypothetical protein ACLFR1_13405 [Spirochaetia bacterium]
MTAANEKPFIFRHPFWLPYGCAFILAVLYFLFNMHYTQQFVDQDQVVYINNIYYASLPGHITMNNPHHLHFEMSGVLFHQYMLDNFSDYGFTDRAFNLRIRSLLAACIGIFFGFLFFYEITNSLLWSLGGTLCIGMSHVYVHYATKIDTAIFPAAMLLIIFWFFLKLSQQKRLVLISAVIGGVLLAAAVLAHQYLAVICVLFCFAAGLPPYFFLKRSIFSPMRITTQKLKPAIDAVPWKRYACVFLMAIIGILLIVTAYFYGGKTQYNLPFDEANPEVARGPFRDASFQQWLFYYQHVGEWGGELEELDPRAPFRGFTDAFLSQHWSGMKWNRDFTFRYDIDAPLDRDSFIHNQVALFTVLCLAGAVLFLPWLYRRYGRLMLLIIPALAFYVFFFADWEPFYFEFWIIPQILCVITLVLVFHMLGEKISGVLHGIGRLPFLAYLFFFAFTLYAHNSYEYLAPFSRIQHWEGIWSHWPDEYWQKGYSDSVYRHPENRYQDVYATQPGSVYDYSVNRFE